MRLFAGLILTALLAGGPTLAKPLSDAQLVELGENYLEAWNKNDFKLLKKWVTDDYIEQAGGETELKRKLASFSERSQGTLTEITVKTEDDVSFVRFAFDTESRLPLTPSEKAFSTPRKPHIQEDGWFRVESVGPKDSAQSRIDIWMED